MFALTPYSGVEPVDDEVPQPLPQQVEVKYEKHMSAPFSGRA
jgi:hypothetical protein